jgi:hypothetical protein
MAEGVCLPQAVPAYLEFCRATATAILEEPIEELAACAFALQTFGSLTSMQIDEIISTVTCRQQREAELARRRREAARAVSAAAATVAGTFEPLPPR